MKNSFNECGEGDGVFFVFDSYSLDQVESKLYGYVVNDTGIHTGKYVGELSGDGCYVRITADNNRIRIEQDSNGSFGLYLYQQGPYFALSNSFFRLQDFLKARVSLNANMDYIYQFLALDLCSLSYDETAIKEIKCLDKDAEVLIDKRDRTLNIGIHRVALNTIPIDSLEGCTILDSWFKRWCGIIKKLSEKNSNISVDLSGGFDSRLSFLLVLSSGCDLNTIRVNSVVSNNKVHQADYQIAKQIADYFGFVLNNKSFSDAGGENLSLEQAIGLAFDSKMTFHQKASLITKKRAESVYLFTGSGGELIRAYWDKNDEDMILYKKKRSYIFGNRLALKVFNAIQGILSRSMACICEKYGISARSNLIGHYLYHETRCRNHFGKMMVEGAASGNYYLSPLMDKELHRLKTNFSGMSDSNALISLILTRYCPDLLKFKFEGGREIDTVTLKRAREVCDLFKYCPMAFDLTSGCQFCIPTKSIQHNSNVPISEKVVDDYFKRIVCSCDARELITKILSKEVYEWSISKMDEKGFLPAKPWHAIIGVLKVLDNVELSKRNQESYKSTLDRFFSGGAHISTDDGITYKDIRILAFRDNKYNWWNVAHLQSGKDYEFTADEVVVEEGKTDLVEVIIYESQKRSFCSRKKFKTNGKSINWRFTVPHAEGDYSLLLYAGEVGKTEGIGVLYRNVRVVLTPASQ